jgi:hypothetical protein
MFGKRRQPSFAVCRGAECIMHRYSGWRGAVACLQQCCSNLDVKIEPTSKQAVDKGACTRLLSDQLLDVALQLLAPTLHQRCCVCRYCWLNSHLHATASASLVSTLSACSSSTSVVWKWVNHMVSIIQTSCVLSRASCAFAEQQVAVAGHASLLSMCAR